MSKQKQEEKEINGKSNRKTGRAPVHRDVKDRLFRFLFEKDRKSGWPE